MALFSQDALQDGVRKREVFGWAMYDFANSGYTTVVLTAVFNAYFVGAVAGKAEWATFAWTAALAVSRAIVMFTMPTLGAYADLRAAKKRLLALTTAGCVLSTAALFFVGAGDVALAIVLIVLSILFYAYGECLTAAFLPELARPQALGRGLRASSLLLGVHRRCLGTASACSRLKPKHRSSGSERRKGHRTDDEHDAGEVHAHAEGRRRVVSHAQHREVPALEEQDGRHHEHRDRERANVVPARVAEAPGQPPHRRLQVPLRRLAEQIGRDGVEERGDANADQDQAGAAKSGLDGQQVDHRRGRECRNERDDGDLRAREPEHDDRRNRGSGGAGVDADDVGRREGIAQHRLEGDASHA